MNLSHDCCRLAPSVLSAFLFVFATVAEPIVLVHRGGRYEEAWKAIPENTVEKFDLAIKSGCKAFETDVKMTADGVLVIAHDALLNHYLTNVTDQSQIEFSKADAVTNAPIGTSSCHIPTLAQLLESFKRVEGLQRIEFEMKVKDGRGSKGVLDYYRGENLTNYCNRLYAAVSEALPAGTYAFTSFDAEAVKTMKKLHPEASTGYIENKVISWGMIKKAQKYGCDSISPKYPTKPEQVKETVKLIAVAKKRKINVGLWMIETPETYKNSATYGAYEVTSDRPLFILK